MKQRIKTFPAGGLLALTLFGAAAAGPPEDAQGQGLARGHMPAAVWWRNAEQANRK